MSKIINRYKNKIEMALDIKIGDVVNSHAIVEKVKASTVLTDKGSIYIFGNGKGIEVLKTLTRDGELIYEAKRGGNQWK